MCDLQFTYFSDFLEYEKLRGDIRQVSGILEEEGVENPENGNTRGYVSRKRHSKRQSVKPWYDIVRFFDGKIHPRMGCNVGYSISQLTEFSTNFDISPVICALEREFDWRETLYCNLTLMQIISRFKPREVSHDKSDTIKCLIIRQVDDLCFRRVNDVFRFTDFIIAFCTLRNVRCVCALPRI